MTPERFVDLYRSERKDLARSIARIAGPDQAEDLVHDAFLAYLTADPGADRPGAWLSRVARNRALNHVRRPRSVPLTQALASDGEGDPGLSAEREATRALVATTLEGLSERSRLALQLRFVEGRSYEEISVALDVRVAQAHVVVHRAIRRFGRALVHRIAEAHGAEECAETVSSLAGIEPSRGRARHGISACSRCRSIWDELVALRSLPAVAPALPLARLRSALESVWRRSSRFAEPAGHLAQVLAAAGVAMASVAGVGTPAATVPAVRSAHVVAPQSAPRTAVEAHVSMPATATASRADLQSGTAPVTSSKVDAGVVR